MERKEKENILEVVTGWSPQLIRNLNDDELDRVYRERVEARNELFYEGNKRGKL